MDSETKPEKASGLGNRPFAKSASLYVEAPGRAVALQKAQQEPLGHELARNTVVLESGNGEEERLQAMRHELGSDDQLQHAVAVQPPLQGSAHRPRHQAEDAVQCRPIQVAQRRQRDAHDDQPVDQGAGVLDGGHLDWGQVSLLCGDAEHPVEDLLDPGSGAGVVARVVVDEVHDLLHVLAGLRVEEPQRERGRLRVDVRQLHVLDSLADRDVAKNGQAVLQAQLMRLVDAHD